LLGRDDMEVIVYARSDGSLCRVLPSNGAPEREARRMSYGHPFAVQVAARVPGVDEGVLREALRAGEVGAGWYRLPLADVLEAVARAAREPAEPRPGRKRRAERAEPEPGRRKRAEREASEQPEELGAWQRWLEPCRSSLAPRATVVKAALRERGAPSWLLPLCREVSQKDARGHYRKILKIGSQTVQAVSARDPAPPAAG
jgi:hypothetical protein